MNMVKVTAVLSRAHQVLKLGPVLITSGVEFNFALDVQQRGHYDM